MTGVGGCQPAGGHSRLLRHCNRSLTDLLQPCPTACHSAIFIFLSVGRRSSAVDRGKAKMIKVTRCLLLAGLSSLAIAAPAQAQQNQEAVQDAPTQAQAQGDTPDQQTIIVTGTRRADRTVANSPVPVDVISAETLSHSGFTELNRQLTQEVPSFNFPQPSITDGTDVIRPATLRGLGPDQTLVLMNGKRRHTSALLNINGSVGRGTSAVDVNMIPTIAISRVEVLRDGAAAQYGSDAIAGVINIQLKNADHGGRASVTWGKYYTTVDNVANVTGLQLNGAGLAQL